MKIRFLSTLLILGFILTAVSGCNAQNTLSGSLADASDASSAVPDQISEEESTKQELQKQLEEIQGMPDTSGEEVPQSDFSQTYDNAVEDMQEALNDELSS